MEFIGIFLVALVFVALVMLYLMYLKTPKGKQKGNRTTISTDFVAGKWAEINSMMAQGGPANYKQAIFEADKLVDAVLRSKVSGETMGERLKNAKKMFSYGVYNDLWTAHKIRNKLAHEADFQGLSSEATLAVRYFEKALKELRVI